MGYIYERDAPCPACGFEHGSEYRMDDDTTFICCGHCNWDTREHWTPTPQLVIPHTDEAAWLFAEKKYQIFSGLET